MEQLKIEIKYKFKFHVHILNLILFSSLLFSGCELFLNEAVDCIAKVKPKLPDKNLASGKLGVEYFESIIASATNHVNDDDFAYYFDMMGRPPLGINYYIDHRTIYFSGVPTEKGEFSFSIKLSIGEGLVFAEDGICFSDDSTSKIYTIIIN
jgi:hypothetical protein